MNDWEKHISANEERAFKRQPRSKLWADGSPIISVLDGYMAHEWPASEQGLHELSPKCPCEPFYGGMHGRLQTWEHRNPMYGVRPRVGLLPIAYWAEENYRLHTSWGWTKRHAATRAARWGRKNNR